MQDLEQWGCWRKERPDIGYRHFGARFHVSVLSRRALFLFMAGDEEPSRAAAHNAGQMNPVPLIVVAVLMGAGFTWLWCVVVPSAGPIEILLWCLAVLLCGTATVVYFAGQKK